MFYKQRGFSLIELMVVVAIVAILAAIAYPNYSNYSYRARRADGKEMLMRLASAQERHYTNLNSYTGSLAALNLGATSEKGFYNITITLANNGQTYTATATPVGVQAPDKCGSLTLTNSGRKDKSGDESNGACW